MEIGRLINVERITGKLPSDEARGNGKPKKKSSSEEGTEGSTPVAKNSRAAAYSTPINFEYLPSGKIHLNREAREQIIDFFE